MKLCSDCNDPIYAAWREITSKPDWRERMFEADEPCEHGHFGCSMSGVDGGPCYDEYCANHPEENEHD